MKMKTKKFGLGGPTSYSGEDDGEGMKMSTPRGQTKSSPSFNEAFRAARKEGLKTFKWKGGNYGTELASESKKPSKATFTAVAAPPPKAADAPKADTPARRVPPTTVRAKLPEGYKPKVGSGRYDDPESKYVDRLLSPLKKFSDIFGLREQERVMRDMNVDRAEAAKRLSNLKEMEEGEGMRRGGKVKRYASGGSVSSASKRADGIAIKGKTRGKFV